MTDVARIDTSAGPVRRIRANNPSPLTGSGTNTYLIGQGDVAVIDPGPDMDSHLRSILNTLGPDEKITHILVTHSHLDHSALVPALKRETDAPVYAFGDSTAGRSAHLQGLTGLGGGEGVDHAFTPDEYLGHDATLSLQDQQIRAIWTPGHFGNHLCFEWGDALFSGDLVMGWSTSLVSPPDGDLTAFMASLAHLKPRSHSKYLPGHGDTVTEPKARVQELIDHRLMRAAQILEQLSNGPADAKTLTAAIYTDVPKHLHNAAARNVLSHLIDLTHKNMAKHSGALTQDTVFSRN